ncbi:MAG: hypothetical protein ABI282_03230 [Candidatus Baltobacteraceae bacterium]
MRYHRRGRPYWLQHDREKSAALFRPENLAVARLEPTVSNRYEGILDLTFERDGIFAVLPLVIVDAALIVGRETSPFAWPAGVRDFLDEQSLKELEWRLEPWLHTRLLARFENDEVVKVFKDDAGVREAFERARGLGLFGAAPLTEVLRNVTPCVYAYRFAEGGRAFVSSAGVANGAALLYGRAARVDWATDNTTADRFARSWFGTQKTCEPDADAHYDVAIIDAGFTRDADVVVRLADATDSSRRIPVCRPLPLAVFASFDPDDSAVDGEFSVQATRPSNAARESVILKPLPVGGSGGRITVLVREDWSRAQDADSDAIRALHARLQAEGFTVRIVEGWSHLDSADTDLVHVIGTAHASIIREKIAKLHADGIPIVTSPLADDPKGEAPWGGPITNYSFRNTSEETTLGQYLDAMAVRRLNAEGLPLYATLPLPPNPDVVSLLNCSSALIVSGAEEEALVRERFGYTGRVLAVPPLVQIAEPANVDAIAGRGDFIFMHTTIDARSAVIMAALASETQRLPLVLTGPVASAESMSFMHAYAGDLLRYVPLASLTESEIEGLYARARVYADLSWEGRGLSRFARAAGYGASLVASSGSAAPALWGREVTVADPGSVASIGLAFRDAWDAAPRRRISTVAIAAERCNQGAALAGILQAYQHASALLAVHAGSLA